MRPEDVPAELIDLAMTGAAPGCRWDAAFYLANVLPALIGPDTAERIEQIQAERDALPDDERRRREAADAPLLRIQLAAYARKTSELEAELDRTSTAAARHIWREMGISNLLHWKDRAEQFGQLIAEIRAIADAAVWNGAGAGEHQRIVDLIDARAAHITQGKAR